MAVVEIKDLAQLKDSVLHRIAESANIAQFVSFDPQGAQRYARIRGYEVNHNFSSISDAAEALLRVSGSVNIRSFEPYSSKSKDFIYGLMLASDVAANVTKLAMKGLYTIINETIDVNDGGVSGVALGDILEFAPGDTPRCVEKAGTMSIERELGLRLLETVYGFMPALLQYRPSERVEFSIHPIRRGTLEDHTIVWEVEDVGFFQSSASITWPNRFSRFVGDKAFGLLLANTLGLPIPATTAFPRLLPPFAFGVRPGTGDTWIRTCPIEQEPGRYTTHRGWIDPFKLMAIEDPEGTRIASILAQEGVNALYSGSLIVGRDGGLIIEGASGFGEEFMLGRTIGNLPKSVEQSVIALYHRAEFLLGPVRFEWVYDGAVAWIVQLHKGVTSSLGNTIVPGEAIRFHRFDVNEGIEALRRLISELKPQEGIILVGRVGITSHLGDLLRKGSIPSRIEAD
jgi:hypothetical protein